MFHGWQDDMKSPLNLIHGLLILRNEFVWKCIFLAITRDKSKFKSAFERDWKVNVVQFQDRVYVCEWLQGTNIIVLPIYT